MHSIHWLARGEFLTKEKTAGASSMQSKNGIGEAGVELQWYPNKEYALLLKA